MTIVASPVSLSTPGAAPAESPAPPARDNPPSLHLAEDPATPEPSSPEPEASGGPEAPSVKVENTLASVVSALTALWPGIFAFNELSQRIVFRRPAPFQDRGRAGYELRDEDVANIRLWFEQEMGQNVSPRNVIDAVGIVARRNRFHPVRDYLASLTWDGVPRAETWLEQFCSVRPASPDQRTLVRAVAHKWLVACVARAITPGAKVDSMLVLEGKQGIGKSRAVEALTGTLFFSDAPIDFRTKDAMQLVQGVWIYELPELDAVLRGERPATKAFLSRTVDRFRAPYARAPSAVPRSVVFCGTVNHGGYLQDTTGNRRFWIARCEGSIDVDGLRAHRDQLWAEARVLFEKGEPWHLAPEEEALMHLEHQDRMEDDPWEERVGDWIATQGARPLAMDEILAGALRLQAAGRNPNVTRRVHSILEQLGFERQRRSFQHGAGRSYRYVRAASRGPLPVCPTAPEQDSAPSDKEAAARPTVAPGTARAKKLSKKVRQSSFTPRQARKDPKGRATRRR